jgi:hypothetical protein
LDLKDHRLHLKLHDIFRQSLQLVVDDGDLYDDALEDGTSAYDDGDGGPSHELDASTTPLNLLHKL